MRDRRRRRADDDRDERALRVAQLAQAPGPVADADVDERRQAERLHEREVDEQARRRSRRRRPGSEPHSSADRRDDERREVGVRAEELDLRDRGDLEDHHGHAERDEAQRRAAGVIGASRLALRAAASAPGRTRGGAGRRTGAMWTCWSSVRGIVDARDAADRDAAAGTAT